MANRKGIRLINKALHSRFNPSSMPPELLEQTFVQRHDLARRLVQLFIEGADGQSKHHVLLIGPRGIGKSHLVALIYHRLMKVDALRSKLEIAWLAEDEWGVTSFADLLLKVLQALGTESKDLFSVINANVEKLAEQMLRERLSGKTLLLIIENLDTVLRNLGDSGQRKLRALIQNTGQWSILATATALSEDVQRHASPFYGFFEIHNLHGLSDDDGITMLHRLAIAQGKTELAQLLTTPGGRARVRALQHLAQGNHRVLIVFYDFLDEDSREDLLSLLWKTIDALTPYYQSQMKDLSPQQRKLVDFLCHHRVPATVKTIASQTLVTHQTAAAQLKQLLDARYVRVERHGRESYYELAEPLLRICVEAKSHGSEPLPLLVELLRYWFSRRELESRLQESETNWASDYFKAALHKYEEGEGHSHLSILVRESCARMRAALRKRDAEGVRAAAGELAEIAERDEDWSHYANAMIHLGEPTRALPRIEEAGRTQPNEPGTQWALAKVYLACERPHDALPAIERALQLTPSDDVFWREKGDILSALHRYDDALKAFLEAKRLQPRDLGHCVDAAHMMRRLQRPRDAVRLLQGLVQRGVKDPAVLASFGQSLAASGKMQEALVVLEEATHLFPKEPQVWLDLARCKVALGNLREAGDALDRALTLRTGGPNFSRNLCLLLFRLDRHKEALDVLPPDAVAHGVFHKLVDLTDRPLATQTLRNRLVQLRRRVDGPAWAAAFRGGLWEFLSHIAASFETAAAEGLTALSDVLQNLDIAEPEFALAKKFAAVMARYKTTGDSRALLELPLEQRRLLPPTIDNQRPPSGTRRLM